MDKLHNRSNFHNPKRFFMIMQLHLQWVFTIGKKGFSLPTILDCTRFKGRKFRGRFWDYQDSIFKVLNIKEGHKSLIRMLIIISQPTRSLQFVSRPNQSLMALFDFHFQKVSYWFRTIIFYYKSAILLTLTLQWKMVLTYKLMILSLNSHDILVVCVWEKPSLSLSLNLEYHLY